MSGQIRSKRPPSQHNPNSPYAPQNLCPECGVIVPWQQAVAMALQPYYLTDQLTRAWRRPVAGLSYEAHVAVRKALYALDKEKEEADGGSTDGPDRGSGGGSDLGREPKDDPPVGRRGASAEHSDSDWTSKVFSSGDGEHAGGVF